MGWVNDKGANSAPQFKKGGKVKYKEQPEGPPSKKTTVSEKNKAKRDQHKRSVQDKVWAGEVRRRKRKGKKKMKAYPTPPELPKGRGRD